MIADDIKLLGTINSKAIQGNQNKVFQWSARWVLNKCGSRRDGQISLTKWAQQTSGTVRQIRIVRVFGILVSADFKTRVRFHKEARKTWFIIHQLERNVGSRKPKTSSAAQGVCLTALRVLCPGVEIPSARGYENVGTDSSYTWNINIGLEYPTCTLWKTERKVT